MHIFKAVYKVFNFFCNLVLLILLGMENTILITLAVVLHCLGFRLKRRVRFAAPPPPAHQTRAISNPISPPLVRRNKQQQTQHRPIIALTASSSPTDAPSTSRPQSVYYECKYFYKYNLLAIVLMSYCICVGNEEKETTI